ncbi:hypothetical protein C8R43DRAFT_1061015 [Mycena crocata]|nr:hypothetical protein C8R43DRAFT_1061015 [Mycena crocata]
MRVTLWRFIKEQYGKQYPVLKADLTGQTVIMLGANTGLGFEAVKHFATMNPGRLILACRSQSKGQAALEKLQTTTGYTKAELWIIDLSDFDSVKAFADKFERDGGRLDILVENAAVGAMSYYPSKDGYETSLQVNCLSTPLLALRLLPAMIKTADEHHTTPRLVVVASGMHYWVTLDKSLYESPDIFKTLGSAEYCTSKVMQERYSVTKLLNVLFVRALNARLAPATPVVADAVCPGYCYSELRREFTGVMAVFDWLMEKALALPTEVGSRQLVWAALAERDHPEKLRGGYVSRYAAVEPSDFVISAEGAKAQDRVWDDMVAVLGKVDPSVNTIIDKYLSNAVSL